MTEELQNDKNEKTENLESKQQSISVKQIIDAYPTDREKALAYILMGIQNDLNRIANILEYYVKRDGKHNFRNMV